tara:strand:+ start:9971 stop:10114 length:144 start_codon:yes stop_codon:yes gene_type:complete
MMKSEVPKETVNPAEVIALLAGLAVIAVYLYRFRDLIERALQLAGFQ